MQQQLKGRARWMALGLAIAGTTALALAEGGGLNLVMGGKVVSSSVRVIDGRAYVPIADLARSQNMIVVQRGGGYEITAAGGANQVNGKLQGKIGDQLFTGKWSLTVLSVGRAAKYESQFSTDKETTEPNGANEELIVIQCRLKNGKQASQAPMLSSVHPHNIALTDDQGQSYPPVHFDKRGGNSDSGGELLPGAQTNFAVIFSVPKGTSPKDLVFSLQTAYEDYPDGGTDVRISLAK